VDRAFLAVTEWKLRAISGDPSLALPYWNWSSDRTIPAAFAIPTSLLARAARYTPNRPLTSVEVDHLLHDGDLARLGVAALGARAFQAWAPEQIPRTFGGIAKPNAAQWHGRNRLEGSPHTAVHNYIGGEATNGSLGDMTQLSTAANDPLFYAHHANLDRLWENWRSDPLRHSSEPSVGAFLEQRFPFPWLDGTVITVSCRRHAGYPTSRLYVRQPRGVSRRPTDHRYSGGHESADGARPRNSVIATPCASRESRAAHHRRAAGRPAAQCRDRPRPTWGGSRVGGQRWRSRSRPAAGPPRVP
jgi:hypothetical protein